MEIENNQTKIKYGIIALLGMLTAIGPLSLDMYLPALPVISGDMETSASLVQASLTSCLIGLALGQLMFGPLSDIQGRKRPLLITLLIYAVISVLCAFQTNVWIFIILRFIQGFTGAAGIVIARAVVRDMYAGVDLTKAFAFLALINGAAPILAPVSGGFVLSFGSWKWVFIIIGLIGFTLFTAVLLWMKESLPESERSKGGIFQVVQTFGSLLKDKVFMGIALTQALVMSAMFAYIAGSPFVLQNIYEVSPQQFSLIFALNGVGIIISAQLAGRLSARFSAMRILNTGVLISFTGSVLVLTAVLIDGPLFFMIISLFLVVASVGMVSTSSLSLGMQNQKKSAGSAAAFLGLLPFIGGAVVSPIVGIRGEFVSWPMGVVIMSCSFFALIIFLSWVKKPAT
ncbi:multidrug effflux MFS transporter [Corticicoccus populi]|uniref:Bcr/CflA family efflux transporter n=1 Tax=Corticicoccus populi TaxID=1812821 RepID=A0ABW5WT74_9STAP